MALGSMSLPPTACCTYSILLWASTRHRRFLFLLFRTRPTAFALPELIARPTSSLLGRSRPSDRSSNARAGQPPSAAQFSPTDPLFPNEVKAPEMSPPASAPDTIPSHA